MRKQYTNPFLPVNQEFAKAMRDYSIWFHLLEEGEEIEDGLTAIYSMTRALNAARQSKILTAVIALMNEAQARGTWRKADLLLMVHTLQIVSREYPALPRDVARKAIAEVFA